MSTPENEVGRELKASELRPKSVVVINPPGHPHAFLTMWVRDVTPKWVEFYAGELRWHVVNFVQPDGSIHDDQHRTVHVFEYLGEI